MLFEKYYLLTISQHQYYDLSETKPPCGGNWEETMKHEISILRVDSSGRREGSSSRALTDELITVLKMRYPAATIRQRDLAEGMPHVDERWIAANFTPEEDRTDAQKARLSDSDKLVRELQAADILVLGAPIYNFGVPAALKAWVDMVARARLTFRYTDQGPEGLLTGKKAFLVISSGGVPVDSALDFATPYLRQALGFMGITEVEIVKAEQQNLHGEKAMIAARQQISAIDGALRQAA